MLNLGGTPLPATALQPQGINNIMVALERIEPGQLVVYHVGMLARDRSFSKDDDSVKKTRAREIDLIGDRAYAMAIVENRVHLTQFRQGSGYAYVATGKAGCDRPRLH